MSRSLLLGAAIFGAAVNGMAFPAPAAATEVRLPLPFNGMSPKPTAAPFMSDALKAKLGRRADDSTPVLVAPDNTCGYVSASSRASFTCVDPDATCFLLSSTSGVDGFVACCDADDCGFRTACVDSTDIASSCGSSCQSNTYILKCSASSLNVCNSISFSGGAVDYFCNSVAATSFFEAETTYSGQTGRTYDTIDLADYDTTDAATTNTNGLTSAVIPTAIVVTSTAIITPTSSPKNDDGGSNTAAIAGGVVGGVAVIALIAVGAWFLMKKKNKKNDNNNTTFAQNAPPPGPGGPPMNQQSPAPAYTQPGPQSPNMYNQYSPQQPNYQQPYPPQGTPPTQYNQNAPPPMGGWYQNEKAGAQQNLTPEPNRADTASPMSDYNRFSQQPPISPHSTGTPSYMNMQGQPQYGGQAAPVEAGGTPVGQNDAHHKGQLHELA